MMNNVKSNRSQLKPPLSKFPGERKQSFFKHSSSEIVLPFKKTPKRPPYRKNSQVYLESIPNKNENQAMQIASNRFKATSVDEDLVKLESLTAKNLTARYDWISIEQKIIELNFRRKLAPIAEFDKKQKCYPLSDFYREKTSESLML